MKGESVYRYVKMKPDETLNWQAEDEKSVADQLVNSLVTACSLVTCTFSGQPPLGAKESKTKHLKRTYK